MCIHFKMYIIFNAYYFQQDISRASDEAAVEYEKATPDDAKTPEGAWDAMSTAANTAIKAIKSKDFLKYLSVAKPDNGDDFFEEVSLCQLFMSTFYDLIFYSLWCVTIIVTTCVDQLSFQSFQKTGNDN